MAGLTKVKGSGLATGAATDSLVGIADNATSTKLTTTSTGIDVTGTVTAHGATLKYNTALWDVDTTLSSYSSTNGVYLNGNSGGWLSVNADGSQRTRIRMYGETAATPDSMTVTTAGEERMRITSAGTVAQKHSTGQGYLSFLSARSGGSYLNVKTNIYRSDIMYMLKILGFTSYSGERIDTIATGYAYSSELGSATGNYGAVTNHGTVPIVIYYSSDDYLCFRSTTSGDYQSVDIIASTGANGYYMSTPVELLAYVGSGSSANYY